MKEINSENIRKAIDAYFSDPRVCGQNGFLMDRNSKGLGKMQSEQYAESFQANLDDLEEKSATKPQWQEKFVRNIIATYRIYADEPRRFARRPLEIEECYLELYLACEFFPAKLTADLPKAMETLKDIIQRTGVIRKGYLKGEIRNIGSTETIHVVNL